MLAPVVITVYDRIEHFKRCINSLLLNNLAKNTTVYIISDFAFQRSDEEKVIKVRKFIDSITGFGCLRKIYREKNYGVPKNIDDALERIILKEHNSFIRLEDDVVVSKGFLTFINSTLSKYENEKNIFAVTGYTPPINIKSKYDIFLSQRHSPWGFGIWKDRWEEFRCNQDNLLNSDLIRYKNKLNDYGLDLYMVLNQSDLYEIFPRDMLMTLFMIMNSSFEIYPVQSLTKNIGQDGSGIHNAKKSRLSSQVLSVQTEFNFTFSKELNEEMKNQFYKYYTNKYRIIIRTFLYHMKMYRLYKKIKKIV